MEYSIKKEKRNEAVVFSESACTFMDFSTSPPQSDCSEIRKGFHIGFRLFFTTCTTAQNNNVLLWYAWQKNTYTVLTISTVNPYEHQNFRKHAFTYCIYAVFKSSCTPESSLFSVKQCVVRCWAHVTRLTAVQSIISWLAVIYNVWTAVLTKKSSQNTAAQTVPLKVLWNTLNRLQFSLPTSWI